MSISRKWALVYRPRENINELRFSNFTAHKKVVYVTLSFFFKYSLVVPDNIHSNMTFEYYEYNTRLAMPPDRRTMTLDFLSPNKNLP